MAGRKRQEIQLQREIETQEEWEEVMAMEGLWVVDVYQEWCGPCQALVGNFRRLKNELGDPLLNYAIAKADTIDALEMYRGRCEPTFLFYAGGILVSFIHGANSPKVQRVITEQLAQEHKVMEGSAERKEVKDSVMTRAQEKELERQEEEEAAREAEDGTKVGGQLESSSDGGAVVEEQKGYTVAIIKPDAVAQGKVEDIKNEMTEAGIEVITEEERQLTDEEARELYSELQDEEYFEDLIQFITSGPSHVLVITRGSTGETIIKDWRDMIGPNNVEKAKEEAPESMRAKYGEKSYMNALHGSSSAEAAARELAFFFPSLSLPTYQKKKENIQRTLALIRPQAFANNREEILSKIQEAGFRIGMSKEVQLTKEKAAEFYKEHEGQAYFDQLVENMSSGPVLALGLARDEAITAWRDMLGPVNVDEAQESSPGSLRATYAVEGGVNQFHGSDSEEAAKKELNFFFPMEETVAVIKPSAMGTKDAIIEKIHSAGFRIAAHKETTITRDIAELMYPQHADKEYYEDLITSMTSGPTYFMVLSREDAVEGWRKELGNVDPEQARASEPETLRAHFGTDILNNAVHGASNPERAHEEMKAVFGELQFNDDGTVKGEQPDLDEAAVAVAEGAAEPASDVAPEFRDTAGTQETTAESTMDQTSAEPDQTADTTQDVTADETQDVTADTTQDVTAETTQAEETAEPEATQAETTEPETTQEETTEVDETPAETTLADETQADTTQADTTQADTTQGDETLADTMQADDTQADITQADVTQEATAEGETTGADETTKADTTEADKQPEADNSAGEQKGDSGNQEAAATKESAEKPATPAEDASAESKTESTTQEAEKGESTTQETDKGESTTQEAEKGESTTQEAEKGESTTQEAEKGESTKQEGEKGDAKDETSAEPAP